MKWLKSTTQKTWMVQGKTIPACVTPHNDYLIIEDTEYAVMEKTPVVASLIKAGGILVLDEEPAELKNSMDNLQTTNATLQARNTQLEQEIKQLKEANSSSNPVDVEAIKAAAQEEIKAEAVKELQEKQNEIEELKKQLAEMKAEAESKTETTTKSKSK